MWNTPLLTPLLLLLILLITVVVSSRYVNALWNPCSSVGKCALKIIFSSDSSKEVLKHNIKTLTFTYPLSARVVGATQRTSQPVPSIFLYLRCPLQFGELQACPLPGVVFQSLLLSSLSSPPFTVPCKMGLARPHERETWPHPFSLLLFAMVRSSYSPIVCWVLARTSPLVTWSLMRCVVSCDSTSIPWLFFFFFEFCCESPPVHGKMNVTREHISREKCSCRWREGTRERISRISELTEMPLSFRAGFNLVYTAVVCAVLKIISGLEPSRITIEPGN